LAKVKLRSYKTEVDLALRRAEATLSEASKDGPNFNRDPEEQVPPDMRDHLERFKAPVSYCESIEKKVVPRSSYVSVNNVTAPLLRPPGDSLFNNSNPNNTTLDDSVFTILPKHLALDGTPAFRKF
jgi:hypothetical protein